MRARTGSHGCCFPSRRYGGAERGWITCSCSSRWTCGSDCRWAAGFGWNFRQTKWNCTTTEASDWPCGISAHGSPISPSLQLASSKILPSNSACSPAPNPPSRIWEFATMRDSIGLTLSTTLRLAAGGKTFERAALRQRLERCARCISKRTTWWGRCAWAGETGWAWSSILTVSGTTRSTTRGWAATSIPWRQSTCSNDPRSNSASSYPPPNSVRILPRGQHQQENRSRRRVQRPAAALGQQDENEYAVGDGDGDVMARWKLARRRRAFLV